MSQQQLIEELKQLSIEERLALIEIISHTIREELKVSMDSARSSKGNPEVDLPIKRERRIGAVQRLRGIVKFDGDPPTDEEVKDMIADYLIEKYS